MTTTPTGIPFTLSPESIDRIAKVFASVDKPFSRLEGCLRESLAEVVMRRLIDSQGTETLSFTIGDRGPDNHAASTDPIRAHASESPWDLVRELGADLQRHIEASPAGDLDHPRVRVEFDGLSVVIAAHSSLHSSVADTPEASEVAGSTAADSATSQRRVVIS